MYYGSIAAESHGKQLNEGAQTGSQPIRHIEGYTDGKQQPVISGMETPVVRLNQSLTYEKPAKSNHVQGTVSNKQPLYTNDEV